MKDLEQRRAPKQDRSKRRAQQIMDTTAVLLDQVGFDELTTILIAKELGISVGSLYHYFPNKQAILRAIAQSWLKDWDEAMQSLTSLPVESMTIKEVCSAIQETLFEVYKRQKGILPLVHAMYAVPELRDLDLQHDKLVVSALSSLFKRMTIAAGQRDLPRIAGLFLEITHELLVRAIRQKGKTAERTLADLQALNTHLLERYT